jgi:serine-type D-Ala-D-Ala carboxypeptidase (penicillin-binding protein 5/6)
MRVREGRRASVALAVGALLVASSICFGAEPKPAKKKTPDGPSYGAAILMEPVTGQVLFEEKAHERRPPASMTKMMLMLLVAEKVQRGEMHWGDAIVVSEDASKMGGSQVFLKPGESFPLSEMMKAIVIHSANDASVAVAEAAAGSREDFVDQMNQRARELGMKETTYHSPHGLPPSKDQEGDMTTAYDLALLAREIMKHPELMGWADTAESSFRDGSFQLMNTNHLVRTTPWVTGLKTGYTREAGFCVTATAARNKMDLIAVVMGSPTKKQCFEEALRAFNKGFNSFQPLVAVRKGDVVANDVPVKYGNPRFVRIVAGDELSVVAQKGVKRSFSLELSMPAELQAPLDAAAPVGTVVVREDGREIGRVPALAADAVQKQQRFWERFF